MQRALTIFTIILGIAFGFFMLSNEPNYPDFPPLPDDISKFEQIENSYYFTTAKNIVEIQEFYKATLTNLGLVERTLNTAVTEKTLNMVFDGHSSGKAVVVQAVDLNNGKTNVNIRFEDI